MNTQEAEMQGAQVKPQGDNRSPVAWTMLAAAVCTALCLLCSFTASARAAEEETHVFDGGLSLTGNCSTSTIDPVPDPGCPGGEHPPLPFDKHGAVAVDQYGNRYIGSAGPTKDPLSDPSGDEARIDIFNPAGQFITEIGGLEDYNLEMSLAVDSQGYLYLARELPSGVSATLNLVRFKPTEYDGAAGKIEYADPPVPVANPFGSEWAPGYLVVAADPSDDHLLVAGEQYGVVELGSAAEGNTLIEAFGAEDLLEHGRFADALAVDASRHRLYVSDYRKGGAGEPQVVPIVKVLELDPPHHLLFTIEGSSTPTSRFVSETRLLALAADEATGHVFVGDLNAPTKRVYEFDENGEPVSTIGEGLLKSAGVGLGQMAYDNNPASPTQGYLFVPSGNAPGRSLAFRPKPQTAPPVVEALATTRVTTTDIDLHGTVNPHGVPTTYRFEYLTEQAFQEQGESFAGASVAGGGSLDPVAEGIGVSASVANLQPGTAYRVRLFTENELGSDEDSIIRTTFEPIEVSGVCPNQSLRSGPAALLPDCRAYELVTPTDTNGRAPFAPFAHFSNRLTSPLGNEVAFRIEGGALPGLGGAGALYGDPYLASRTPSGWSTAYAGPSSAFAPAIFPESVSPDQEYSFWQATGKSGPAVLAPEGTRYVRFPDGHSQVLGEGSLGLEPYAQGELISEGGGHIIFWAAGGSGSGSPVRLEPAAAPDGTKAVYDLTADGTLHVVSVKPGEVPFGAGENSTSAGASLDGIGVAFQIEKSGSPPTLYLRYDNAETFEIGKGVTFYGIADGGARVFYVEDGNLYRFDASQPPGERVTQFSTTGDVIPSVISSDGSAAYFVSTTAIAAGGQNPVGDKPQPGGQNLYLSREGQVSFVATVTKRDVEGATKGSANETDGLGDILTSEGYTPGAVPARTAAAGNVLLFKSRASLAGYDSQGFAQVYRFDYAADDLRCISCNPTGATSSSDAGLETIGGSDAPRLGKNAWLESIRPDGRRAVFESSEGLVARDVDGRQDVYEWEDQGVGSCATAGGCTYLISSGQSASNEYLWGVSRSGDDVFFVSSDLLADADGDRTPSIYDARVDGGFPSGAAEAGECLGEACQPAAKAPNDPTPASSVFEGAGNVPPEAGRRCPKGKRAVKSGGKVRCVARHKRRNKRHHKHRAASRPGRHSSDNGRAGR